MVVAKQMSTAGLIKPSRICVSRVIAISSVKRIVLFRVRGFRVKNINPLCREWIQKVFSITFSKNR